MAVGDQVEGKISGLAEQKLPEKDRKIKLFSDIFYLSFEVSQGNSILQQLVFEYLHGIRPDWKIDKEEAKKIGSNVSDRIFKRLFPGDSYEQGGEVLIRLMLQ